MKQIDPHTVDFAAIRTLRLVYTLGSFSLAAEKLDVNQSTISYTIDRLRNAFQDPLFVRQGGGIAATDRCRDIVEATSRMHDEFEALVSPTEFEPENAQATISISCNYYERLVILPALMKALRRQAPGLKINVISASGQGKQQLARGDADILIGPVKINGNGFYGRHLFKEHYVCVMDQDNPLADAPLVLNAYVAANHVVIKYDGSWRSRYLVELESRNLTLNQVLSVPSPGNLPNILLGTDMISTIPSRIAKSFSNTLFVCDCPLPAPFEIDLYWTTRSHHSAMHKWLRQLIAKMNYNHS